MVSTTLPPIADAMTLDAIKAICAGLAKRLGPGADVTVMVSNAQGRGVTGLIYPRGCSSGGGKHFSADSYPDLFTAMDAWVAARPVIHRDATIRTMALAIIELTDEHGACRRRDLERRFSVGEVAEFAAAACVRAGEMAGNAPFTVEG